MKIFAPPSGWLAVILFFFISIFFSTMAYVAVQLGWPWTYLYDQTWAIVFSVLACHRVQTDPRLANFRRIVLMEVGWIIWTVAEKLHIRLGRFAPVVFGWMMGSTPVKVP